MMNYNDCKERVIEQANWWHKIGKVEAIDRDVIIEAIDVALTEEEADACYSEYDKFDCDCLMAI